MSETKTMISRREFLKLAACGLGAAAVGVSFSLSPKAALAAVKAPPTPAQRAFAAPLLALITPFNQGQTVIPAATIPKFIDPLPVLSVTGLANGTIQTIVTPPANVQTNIEMKEFKARMLPSTFNPGGAYSGTWVWGYVTEGTSTAGTRDTYTGPVIVAARGTPNTFKFTNNLPATVGASHLLAYRFAIDQSLHWANPDMNPMYIANPDSATTAIAPFLGNNQHFAGSIPAVVHLHGGEDAAATDGGPESWYTSNGMMVGKAFFSNGWDGEPQNYATYTYPNVQEAAPLWFHDHTLGATRLNVYMGLAGAYLLIDPQLALPPGLTATGVGDAAGTDVFAPPDQWDDILVPLVIQDRMFDQNGQLYFPAGPDDPINPALNPEHQYWAPEFFGEAPNVSAAICVNGKTWPYLTVQNERARFFLINGSNARSYILTFKNSLPNFAGYTPAFINAVEPDIWQIGTDQGYLDTPVKVDALVIMPGERAEFIVDFAPVGVGNSVVLHNFGPDVPLSDLSGADRNDPATTGTVMQFRVEGLTGIVDSHYNPVSGPPIRPNGKKITRLVNPSAGTLATGVTPALTRSLSLNEIARDLPPGTTINVNGYNWTGGPLEILVNNSKWLGLRPNPANPNVMTSPPLTPVNGSKADGLGNWLTEFPLEGNTEVWEILNLTADAHPIHTHLAQFQLMNRQQFAGNLATMTGGYYDAYNAAFPGGMYIPAYGPPLAYGLSAASGNKYGGNPAITPFLNGFPVEPPLPNEAGWKDTVRCPPNMVTRFVVRWAPQTPPVNAPASALKYSFIPDGVNQGTGAAGMYDYVWHCHIVDHEDNEMMRPDAIYIAPTVNAPNGAVTAGITLNLTGASFRGSGAPPWTATVNWGDGSATQVVAIVPQSNGNTNSIQLVLPGHRYPSTTSGIYTATITVTDGNGAVGTATFKVAVTKIAFSPTTLNLKSLGVFKVTIYGGATFDVTKIDQTTLRFGPVPFAAPNNAPSRVQISAKNMLVFFDRPDSLTSASRSGSIWGKINGVDFVATKTLRVIK